MHRRSVALIVGAALVASIPLNAPTSAALPSVEAPLLAAVPPVGFSDTAVASVSGSTTIKLLPDGRVVVLQQSGAMRLISGAALNPTPAVKLNVCATSERGLL